MQSSFVVKRSFQHGADCFCTGEQHTNIIQLQKGDRFELTNERKYVEHLGWYFQITINESYHVYILLSDLQKIYEHSLICSLLDLELEINYYEYKVDHALENKEKEIFDYYVQQLEKARSILYKRAAKQI
ncbi:hypothetical protein [Pontibacillus marinus]|uniref:IDEAL domain-containing protein n=1 Tax=Pontibacillus marinus BH030004 = DSM 16465 TaxID=1385511 RepID=A0A0A5HT63_9BACI|nr:hypothetical protein [Pontibacillus marinus]KGX86822.1 hypothetical protein N783_11670 [Pontibacillus marinus BH030004 = DSM 16465]